MGADLQRLVNKNHPCFDCENESCSSHSPGRVEDNETLGFLLINPIHYDQVRGVVVPEAFRELTARDLSTIRKSVATTAEADATREDLIARGRSSIPPKVRMIDEVCIAEVSDIRSAEDGEGRLLAVYDTGLDGKPGHASIFTRTDVLDSKKKRKRVRFEIHQIFKRTLQTYTQFRSSLAS